MSTKCFLTGIMMLGVALQAGAQTWSVGEISFSGVVDGYYSLNFNHPASRYNQLRNFDVEANQFGLNMVKLTMEHAAEPVGFRVDLGFGETFNLIHAGEAEPSAVRNLEQAYVSLKPPGARGFQFDFGEFVTSAGAEVIETYGNWNYSRSLLFTLAIPYYHMGARATVPMGKYFTGGVQLVNGWNDVQDNNSGKTVGLTGALTAGPVSWDGNYYGGPEKPDTNKGWRHLYDTTLLVSKPKASAYLNFDYGVDEEAPGGSDKVWYGVAGADLRDACRLRQAEGCNAADGRSGSGTRTASRQVSRRR